MELSPKCRMHLRCHANCQATVFQLKKKTFDCHFEFAREGDKIRKVEGHVSFQHKGGLVRKTN